MTCPTCHKTRAAIFATLAGGNETIEMYEDYTYVAARGISIKYLAGETYRNVPSAVSKAILAARAGTVEAGTNA